MTILTRLWQVLRFIVLHTFIDPIRSGHLKENPQHPWPRRMRWLVGISVGLYALLTVLGLAAGRLRMLDLATGRGQSIPWATGPFLLLAAIVGLSLAYLAAVHAGWRLQLPLAVLLAVVLGGTPTSPGLSGLLPTAVALLVLFGFGLWRRRRPLNPWEFVVALLVIGSLLASRLLAPLFIGAGMQQWGLTLLGYWISLLTVITAPSALLAGAAMTELAVRLGAWTARGVWEAVPGADPGTRTRRLIGGWLLAVVVVGSLAREVWLAVTDVNMEPAGIALAAGYLLLVAAAGLAVLRFAPGSVARGVPTDVDDLASAWSRTSWPLALLLALSVFGGVVLQLLFSLFGLRRVRLDSFWTGGLAAVAAAAVAIGLGVLWARRGRTAAALLATVFGGGLLVTQLVLLLQVTFDTRQIVSASVLLATGVLIWLLVTRRLTADRGLAIASLLLIGRLHEYRDIIDEPLAAIFAATGGGALLLLGLLWRQLTEYQMARGHSRTLPHYVRVLLALANMTLIGMTVSHFALSGSPGTAQLKVLENGGDDQLGGALLLAALVAGLLLAVRGREGGDQRPGEEFRVDHPILVEPKSPLAASSDRVPPRSSSRARSDRVPPRSSSRSRSDRVERNLPTQEFP